MNPTLSFFLQVIVVVLMIKIIVHIQHDLLTHLHDNNEIANKNMVTLSKLT
jgi:hypothetical protein